MAGKRGKTHGTGPAADLFSRAKLQALLKKQTAQIDELKELLAGKAAGSQTAASTTPSPSPTPPPPPGWNTKKATAKANKQKEETPKTQTEKEEPPKEKLLAQDWEDGILLAPKPNLLQPNVAGVALGNRTECLAAVRDYAEATVPIAVLSPVPIGENCSKMDIHTVDEQGHIHHRTRYFVRVGKSEQPPKRRNLEATVKAPARGSTVVIAIRALQEHADQEIWEHNVEVPFNAARNWLRIRASCKALDIFRESMQSFGKWKSIQVLARINTSDLPTVLNCTGQDGVFAILLPPRDGVEENHNFTDLRFVHLPRVLNLKDAVRQANETFPAHFGVVSTRKGLSLRVIPEDYPAACEQFLGHEEAQRLTSPMYEVTGTPKDWSSENLHDVLTQHGWDCVIDPKPPQLNRGNNTRVWWVRAQHAPVKSTVQLANRLLVISPAPENRKPKLANKQNAPQPAMRWSRPRGPAATERKPLPSVWGPAPKPAAGPKPSAVPPSEDVDMNSRITGVRRSAAEAGMAGFLPSTNPNSQGQPTPSDFAHLKASGAVGSQNTPAPNTGGPPPLTPLRRRQPLQRP